MTLDGTTTLIIIVVIFAIIALVAIWRYRSSIVIDIQAAGAKLGLKGKNEPTGTVKDPTAAPNLGGARISDVKAGKDIRAKDETSVGASVERAEARGSITVTSKNPPAPKA